jgi:transposase-like protein
VKKASLCREHGISEAALYNWKCGDLDVNEAPPVRQTEDKNRRLEQLVADPSLDDELNAGKL